MVPGHIWALEWCPGKYGHGKGAQAHFGTGRLPGHIREPEENPGTYGYRKSSRADLRTGRVPWLIWILVRVQGLDQIHTVKSTQAHMGTGRVYGHICAQEWCLATHGHQNGVQANMGTGMVPGHIWAPEGCPGTNGHRKGARHLWEPE